MTNTQNLVRAINTIDNALARMECSAIITENERLVLNGVKGSMKRLLDRVNQLIQKPEVNT